MKRPVAGSEALIPLDVRKKLEPGALRALVSRLATRDKGGRGGVNVARIVQELLGGSLGAGPEQAALYQAVREAVRQQVAVMPDLHYVQGLS